MGRMDWLAGILPIGCFCHVRPPEGLPRADSTGIGGVFDLRGAGDTNRQESSAWLNR